MPPSERLILVASGPGASGADTVLRILGGHPAAAVNAALGPPLIAAIIPLLVHAPYDVEAWSPRRAAQALTDVLRRLETLDERGCCAAAELTAAVRAVPIRIPVYGRLFLPAELSFAEWVPLVRHALFTATGVTDEVPLALKSGPHAAAVIQSLLRPAGSIIYTVRHPTETVIGLVSSAVDGMRPAEAVDYVAIHLQQARRHLDTVGCKALLVRLEDLVSSTDLVLTELCGVTNLPDEIGWRVKARAGLPTDIICSPRWDHPVVRAHRDQLSVLAKAWGYT